MSKYLNRKSNFHLRPVNDIACATEQVQVGWELVAQQLLDTARDKQARVIAIDCYPGCDVACIIENLSAYMAEFQFFKAEQAAIDKKALAEKLEPHVTEDRVFGKYYGGPLSDFYDPEKVAVLQREIENSELPAVIVGFGATLLMAADLTLLADMPRWEIERRQRAGATNWNTDNADEEPLRKFKRGYFIEWRVADKHKTQLMQRIDYLLETVDNSVPKLVDGALFRSALTQVARRPFRVVPCFDPGPWGGQWLREVCDLPDGPPNYAWSFDCIIEANSLLLGFAGIEVEIPALNLVLFDPVAMLGEKVYARFGAEFPIRFNFLDTMQGGNLSLQVHPLPDYLKDVFGFPYPQDESYYVMEADDDACVYLGIQNGIDGTAMVPALEQAQQGGSPFDAEKYVNKWPAKKHDHFLIPAGTVHASGRNTCVLEISSTPYIFTFKLWDWGRLGMDGKPRPVHINHGKEVICYERDTDWTKQQLINQFEPIGSGDGWEEDKTGLHDLELIETRRHWFEKSVEHDTRGESFQVLNLIEGEQVLVESPENKFLPLEVHYAETFIVPSAVGRYRVTPDAKGANQTAKMGTIKAFVRT